MINDILYNSSIVKFHPNMLFYILIEKCNILTDLSSTYVQSLTSECFIFRKFLFKIFMKLFHKTDFKRLKMLIINQIIRKLFEICTYSIKQAHPHRIQFQFFDHLDLYILQIGIFTNVYFIFIFRRFVGNIDLFATQRQRLRILLLCNRRHNSKYLLSFGQLDLLIMFIRFFF